MFINMFLLFKRKYLIGYCCILGDLYEYTIYIDVGINMLCLVYTRGLIWVNM